MFKLLSNHQTTLSSKKLENEGNFEGWCRTFVAYIKDKYTKTYSWLIGSPLICIDQSAHVCYTKGRKVLRFLKYVKANSILEKGSRTSQRPGDNCLLRCYITCVLPSYPGNNEPENVKTQYQDFTYFQCKYAV